LVYTRTMENNVNEIEKLSKDLNEIEKSILDEYTKDTSKELENFIKTKQKLAKLTQIQKQQNQEDLFNQPILKEEK